MTKSRMSLQIKEALWGEKTSPNHSSDLLKLMERVRLMRLKICQLVEALKAQRASMLQMDKARMAVAKGVSTLAVGSPISHQAGSFALDDESVKHEDLSSYLAVHLSIRSRREQYYASFSENVIKYTEEWERIINVRVSKSLCQTEDLRRDLDHYESKLDGLRRYTNKQWDNRTNADQEHSDRLKRNEEKLFQARTKYTNSISDCCLFLEEVADRGWKDLLPILLKMVQFDWKMTCDEYTICSYLKTVADVLKAIASTYFIKPQMRLKDLSCLSSKQTSVLMEEEETTE